MKIRFRCEIPVYKKLSFTDSGYIYQPEHLIATYLTRKSLCSPGAILTFIKTTTP